MLRSTFHRNRIVSNVILAFAGLILPVTAHAAVISYWPLSNSSYTGTGGNTGLPKDVVGGRDFLNNSGWTGGSAAFAGNIGGPSSSSTIFNGSQGFFGTVSNTTFPTDNFTFEIHAFVPTANQNQTGFLFSSNSNSLNSLQVELDGAGNWKALIDTGGNGVGTSIGSIPLTPNAPQDLLFTRTGGVWTFSDNGVNATGTGIAAGFSGFGAIHLAIAPGGSGPNFTGEASDVTLSSIPEPASVGVIGLACVAALATRRRSSCSTNRN